MNLDYQTKRPLFTDPRTPGPPPCCTQAIDPSATIYQKGYAILNARIALRVDAWNTEVAVFGRNLGDAHYVLSPLDLSSLGFRIAEYGDPRVVGVSVKKRFGGI